MKKAPALKKPNSNAKKQKGEGTQTQRQTDNSERLNPFMLREKMKSRKRMPGANVLMQIQTLQAKTENVLPLAPFQRLVNEICHEQFEERFRWTSNSLKALQTSAEDYMVGLF
jgi:hypothetical protein